METLDAQFESRKTKSLAQVIEITLDNGEKITCTPDHKFRLADGTYKEAQKLLKTNSLASHKNHEEASMNHKIVSITQVQTRCVRY